VKKNTLLYNIIMIFFSKNDVSADYDKVFFDFKIIVSQVNKLIFKI